MKKPDFGIFIRKISGDTEFLISLIQFWTKAIQVQVEQRFAESGRKFLHESVTKNIPRLSPIFLSKMPQCKAYVYLQNFF